MYRLAIIGLGLFVLVSAASLFGRAFWAFELLTHFRVQYVVAGAVIALLLALCRGRIGACVALAVAAAHAVPLTAFLDAPTAARAAPGRAVRVATLNLRHQFVDVDATRRLIRDQRPDIVVLTEYIADHVPMMDSLRDILPHRVGTPPRSKFDVVVLSRFPVASSRIHFPAAPFFPVVEARLCPAADDPAACFALIALHSPRPESARGESQRTVFDFVARRAASAADGRVVVAGDLNTTPFSPRFRDLLAGGGLRDSARGAAWRTTWISRFPPFGLALDHVLVGRDVASLARRVADDIGSDHFPLIVDVAMGGS